MRVLVVASRFPWPPYSGDRLRTTVWIDALRPHAAVTLVAPAGARNAESFFPAKRSLLAGLRGAVAVMRHGLPWQTLFASAYAWDAAIARATAERGPFDATILVLSRVEPWVRSSLPPGPRLLDAIDSLARSMGERARAASPLTRWIWRGEEKRTAELERTVARTHDHVLFVSDDEAAACGANGVAVSNGVAIRPLVDGPRRFDFGFWGRLAYFANADAARWLALEIWPAIREKLPSATLVIAGAHAPSWLRRAAERQAGVTLLSPVEDIPELARDVRVALFPLRYGTGESTKLLEAAEAGCAVVSTERGVRSLAALASHAVVAEESATLVREAVALLGDEPLRALLASRLRTTAVERYARSLTLERLAALVRRTAA